MEEVKNWLESDRDYDASYALVAKFSKNRKLLQHLGLKKKPGKWLYELSKLASVKTTVVKIVEIEETDDEILGKSTRMLVNPEELPEHLKELWKETSEMYLVARVIHSKLKLITEQEEREKLLEEMEALRIKIQDNWSVIDEWKLGDLNRGEFKPIDEKRINANRKYLSEGKKRLPELSGAVKAKKFEAMQGRINELIASGEKFDPDNQKELEELGLKFNE